MVTRAEVEIRGARAEYFDGIKTIIVRGVESGCFVAKDPTITAYAFLGMCNWAYKWYPAVAAKRPPEEVATALCGPLLHGLKAK